MESKLVSKDCTGRLSNDRIELLTTRIIVSGKNVPEADNKLKRKLKSRRKRGSPGMFRQAFNMLGSLPTIKETDDKSLDDISSQTACERSRVRLFDGTSMDGIGRPRRRIRFNDHVEILGEEPKSPETTPEKNISESSSPEKLDEDEEWRPGSFFFAQQYLALSKEHEELREFTRLEKQVYVEDAVEAAMIEHNRTVEKLQRELAESEKTRRQILEQLTKLQNHSSDESPELLRTRLKFFMQQYLSVAKQLRKFEESTELEKQIFVQEAVEAAMIEHNRTVEKLQRELAESEKTRREILEQFTKLQNHSSESDKRLDEFQRQLSESANCLRARKSEKDSLVGELSKLGTTRNASEMQTSSDDIIEKETSNIFSNNAYFEEMNVLDSQCDTILTNDAQNTNKPDDDSMKSMDIANASCSELIRKIGEKIILVRQALFNEEVSPEGENAELEYIPRKKIRKSDDVENYTGELKSEIEKLKETINLLTTENIELSKNVRMKNDELSRFRAAAAPSPSADHNIANQLNQYRESIHFISELNKILECENVVLTKSLMEKIEENYRLEEKGEITSLKGDVKDLRESKNGPGETLQLKIQREIFPHMKKCNDLEKKIASLTRKNELLKSEIGKIRETRAREMSSEFERYRRQWRTSKRDQASQCTPEPESTPIYTSGTSSEIVDGRMKVQKLEKDAGISKSLGRNRHKRTRMILPKTVLRRTLRRLVTRA